MTAVVVSGPMPEAAGWAAAGRNAGGKQHGFALRLEIFGEFADGGGFAHAVDARKHDDDRLFSCSGNTSGFPTV